MESQTVQFKSGNGIADCVDSVQTYLSCLNKPVFMNI